MRVAQVYRDYFSEVPGGIERHVRDLAHGWAQAGESEVIASARGTRRRSFLDGNVRVELLPEFGRPGGLPVSPGIAAALRRKDLDLVHVHSPHPVAELALAARRPPVPVVATYHADIVRGAAFFPAYKALLARVYARANAVIATSHKLVESSPVLARVAQRHPDLLHVVPLGVDTSRFTPVTTPRSAELRSSWGAGPFVLFVGRLRYYKGLDDLIAAMRTIDASLVVAGDGPERDRLTALGAALGDRMIMLGEVAEGALPDVYRACDVFCLPSNSRAEAFGMAALEAMASGLPIVTTEVGTATSLVNVDGVTGFVVPPRAPDALADRVSVLLADDGARRSKGTAARDRVVAGFSTAAMIAAVRDIYSATANR